jgi:N-acetylmuramoyl-L-alanine amidase
MQTLRLCIFALLCAALSAGCTWPPPTVATTAPPAPSPPPEQRMTDLELAEMLDLEIDRYTPSMVRLRDGRNIVTIFPDPGGEVRVNGTVLAVHGGVPVRKGRCRLPKSILDEIRPLLKTAPKKPVVPPRPSESAEPELPVVIGRVLLDPGHGGKDPGAHRADMKEKDIVLDLTRRTASHLKQRGVKVFVTRNTDTFVELDDRVAAAAKVRPDLFVSIHADSNPDPDRRGYTIFVPHREKTTSESYDAARQIKAAFGQADVVGWGIRSHPVNLRVLEKTRCPAVLVEVGHLSNRYDRALLGQTAYREKLAGLLARAIATHLARTK